MVEAPHKLSHILDQPDSRVLRIRFIDGCVFRLSELEPVDTSIYGDTDRWCGRVDEPVSGTHPKFKHLYPVGSCVDIHEHDIAEVIDESLDTVIYARE